MERLADIRRRIAVAAQNSGRKASDITLVGVTKTVDAARVAEFVSLGGEALGENRVQELVAKAAQLKEMGMSPQWHMIGRLQTNKVKAVVGLVVLIHSVDSLRLAREIDKRAADLGVRQDVLAEVNISGESTKAGLAPAEVAGFVKQLQEFPNIRLRGLMTLAPLVEHPEDSRYCFRKMKQLFIDISSFFKDNRYMDTLSMGMSGDFEIAIEEGANMVRIGTGIFGGRANTR